MPTPATQPENLNQSQENPAESLTPDDLKKLTQDLSTEIDAEIKKQLANAHPFVETQSKVDQVLKQAEEVRSPEPKKPPEISPPNSTPAKTPKSEPTLLAPKVEPDLASSNLDPLQASLNAALSQLKEGDRIGDGWTLKKIYSTSFGHNRSSFYELENQAGAKWTLSPEEMKDALKSNLQKDSKPADLAPAPSNSEAAISTNAKGVEIKKLETKSEEKKETKAEPQNSASSDDGSFSKEQLDFLTKLHADQKLWQAFTSFKTEQLEKVQTLYEKGQLLEFGIDAHPLLDKINLKNLGREIEIKKGDSYSLLLEKEDNPLTYSNKDSILLGLHILANGKLLKDSLNKIEAAGVSIEALPNDRDIISLVKDGNSGNNQAYSKLSQFLRFLPVNSKFRVFTPNEVKGLEKYFSG